MTAFPSIFMRKVPDIYIIKLAAKVIEPEFSFFFNTPFIHQQ